MGHVMKSLIFGRCGSCAKTGPHLYAFWASSIASRATRVSLTDRGARRLVPHGNPLLAAALAVYGLVCIGVGGIAVSHYHPPGTRLTRVACVENARYVLLV